MILGFGSRLYSGYAILISCAIRYLSRITDLEFRLVQAAPQLHSRWTLSRGPRSLSLFEVFSGIFGSHIHYCAMLGGYASSGECERDTVQTRIGSGLSNVVQ